MQVILINLVSFTCSLVGALSKDFRSPKAWRTSPRSHLLFPVKKRSNSLLSTLESLNDMTTTADEEYVPRQADVADAISHVTAAGECRADSRWF